MNLHTLHLEHIWLLLVYSCLTMANTRFQKGMRGVYGFTLYNLFALAGAIAVASRGLIPEFISVVFGNVFVLAAYLVLFLSVSRTFGYRRLQTILAFVLFAVGSVAMVYYGALHPETGPRLVAYSLTLALQQVLIAVYLLFGDTPRRRVSWMLAAMLFALAGANITRIALVYFQGVPDDYLRSGFSLSAIVLANTCLQCGVVVAYIWMTTAMLRRDLELQATTDPLTGLLNRRALEAAAERELQLCHLGGLSLSAIVIDLDNYKRINDQLGHAAGDGTLIAVARCLQGGMRPNDILARTGGDEFVALLPQSSAGAACSLAEDLRSCLQQLDLGLTDASMRVTGSFGVAETSGTVVWDDLLQRCDGALYEAKHTGGNRVLCHAGSTASSTGPPPAGKPIHTFKPVASS